MFRYLRVAILVLGFFMAIAPQGNAGLHSSALPHRGLHSVRLVCTGSNLCHRNNLLGTCRRCTDVIPAINRHFQTKP